MPAEQIVATAHLLWDRRPVSYFHWTGLEQHTNSTQTVRAISLLYALTGSFDEPGGNVRTTRPPSDELGALSLLPKGQLEKALGLESRPLGISRHGWILAADLWRAIVDGIPYRVHGMVGFGGNMLLSQPGARAAREALTRLDFLVFADLFLTPTAALADVVLPVSSAWEREGLRVGFGPTHDGEQWIQLRPAVIAPLGESRSDTWIACELAKRLGLGKQFFDGDVDAGHRFTLEPCRIPSLCRPSSPASAARSPLRHPGQPRPSRPGAARLAARPAPQGVTLAGPHRARSRIAPPARWPRRRSGAGCPRVSGRLRCPRSPSPPRGAPSPGPTPGFAVDAPGIGRTITFVNAGFPRRPAPEGPFEFLMRTYSPDRHPDLARKRRDLVLALMRKHGGGEIRVRGCTPDRAPGSAGPRPGTPKARYFPT